MRFRWTVFCIVMVMVSVTLFQPFSIALRSGLYRQVLDSNLLGVFHLKLIFKACDC